MPSALVSITLAFLLGASSLVLVLFRVSPVTAPEFALPFLFASVLVTASAGAALLLCVLKCVFALRPAFLGGDPAREEERMRALHHPFLYARAFVGSSLRQGVFFGLATMLLLFLFLLQILNWWIALLVYTVFLLIEMAVGR